MELFFEIHRNLPREIQGAESKTKKALSMLPRLSHHPWILDIGCGTGSHTLELAHQTGGTVVAVDQHTPNLKEVEVRALKEGLSTQVFTKKNSIFSLSFPNEEFDLIWSDGAISVVGFEKGLAEWKRFLKPGGALVVSDLSWLKPLPPEELRKYWKHCYPEMKTITDNLQLIKESGLCELGYFVVPGAHWWQSYYKPLEKRIQDLQKKYAKTDSISELLAKEQEEIDLFKNFPEWYSPVFYVMQRKIDN